MAIIILIAVVTG